MKYASLVLVAVLAVTALAAPPASARRAFKVPASNYERTASGYYREQASPLTKRDDSIALNESVTSQNSALSSTNGRDPITGYAIDMRMGGDKQLVGTLRSQRLWDAIYDCLKTVGSPTEANAKDPNFCKSGNKGCAKDCTIPHIVNDANDNGKTHTPKYTNDGKLVVTALWSEYFDPGVRDLTYRLVANLYRLMTMEDSNCYQVDFPNSRTTKMCQILSNVLVAFPTNGGRTEALLSVQVTYSKKIYGTDFNCDAVRAPVDKEFKANYRPSIAKEMGWSEDALVPYVSCPQPNCFETKQYQEGQPFKDDPGCNSLANTPL